MTEDSLDPAPASEGTPYDPPKDLAAKPESSPAEEGPDKPKRPGAPFGIGLTLIICGSLAVLSGIFGGLFSMVASSELSRFAGLGAMGGNPAPNQAFDAVMMESKSVYIVQGVLQIVMGVISVLALVAGIGLVKYRRWGRKLSLLWAVVAVGYILVSLVINFVYIIPKSNKMMEAMMGTIPENGGDAWSGMVSSVTGISQIMGSLLLAVLPVLTLILISKDKIEKCLS